MGGTPEESINLKLKALSSRSVIDTHRFISSHNVFNYIYTTLFMLYLIFNTLFSTVADSTIKGYGDVYRILYLVLTGIEYNPTQREMSCMVVLSLVLLVVLLIVSITTKPKSEIIPSLHFIKLAAVVSFYILPIIVSITITVFTTAFQLIPIGDDPIPFILSILGFAIIIYFVIFAVIFHSSTAYKVPHIFFMKNLPFGIFNMLGIVAFHTITNFSITASSIVLYISAILSLIAGIISIIFMPSDDNWMNTLNSLFFFGATACTIIEVANLNYNLVQLVYIHLILFAVIALIHFGIRRIFECRCSKLKQLTYGHVIDATDDILNSDLSTISELSLWSICRNSEKLQEEALLKLQSELHKRFMCSSEHPIFMVSFDFIVAERLGQKMPFNELVVSEFRGRLDAARHLFWYSAWAADYARLPVLGVSIGQCKYTIQDNICEMQESSDSSGEEKHKLSHCTLSTMCYIFAAFFIVCLSVFFLEQLCEEYEKTVELQLCFYEMRELMTEVDLMLGEVWRPEKIPQLGEHFEAAKALWEDIKESKQPQFIDLRQTMCSNLTLQYWLDFYFEEVQKYASDPENYNVSIIRQPQFRYCFREFFMDYTSSFYVNFKEDFIWQFWVTVFLHIAALILIIILFFVNVKIKSKRLQKMYQKFRYISKAEIGEMICVPKDTVLLSTMPLESPTIEWEALHDHILANVFVCFLILCGFILDIALFFMTESDINIRNSRLEFFGYLDTSVVFMANEFYGVQTVSVNATEDMMVVDDMINKIKRYPDTQDMAALMSNELIHVIASYLIQSTPEKLSNISIITDIITGIPPLEHSIRILPSFMIARTVTVILIGLSITTFTTYYMLTMVWKNEYAEREGEFILKEFLAGRSDDHLKQSIDYDLRTLPFPFAEITARGHILFATNEAREELGLQSSNISRSNISDSMTADIHASLKQFRANPVKEPIILKSPDSRGFLLMPTYSGKFGTDLISYSLFKLPNGMLSSDDGDECRARISQIYPPIIDAQKPFPQLLNVEAKPLLVVMVRVNGLNQWAGSCEDGRSADLFVRSLLAECDAAGELGSAQFIRLSVSSDCIVYITSPDTQIAGRWTFITVAAEFANRIRKAVRKLAARFEAPLFASVVFSRNDSQQVCSAGRRCTQTECIGDAQMFTYKALSEFGVDGVGFASIKRAALRIPDTSLIKTYQYGEQLVDLFLVV